MSLGVTTGLDMVFRPVFFGGGTTGAGVFISSANYFF
jgi:hypothetical protein